MFKTTKLGDNWKKIPNRFLERKQGGDFVKKNFKVFTNGSCQTIVDITDNKIVDYCVENEEKAMKKVDELLTSSKTSKPSKIKKNNIIKSKMMNWRQFLSENMKGKKFEGKKGVNDFMKELSKEFKELKNKESENKNEK